MFRKVGQSNFINTCMIITTAVRYAVTALHSCCFYVSARADWLVEALCSQVVHVSVHSSVTKLVKTIF